MTNESIFAVRPLGVREVNTGTVLEILRRRQTTRTELIRLSGLSKATVSVIVADLLERGLVQTAGRQQEGRGRSRVVLQFNPLARSVLGAQIADDVCTIVLTDLDGKTYRRTARPLRGTDPGDVVDALVEGVTELRPFAVSPVLGLGVGTPGVVDRAGRHITMAVSHGWRDVPMAALLEEHLGVPVLVANRAKVAALGHVGHGERDRPTDLIYVFLGRGVIAGLVIDGQLCFGRDGWAGDIGHVTVRPDGVLCGCGNRGCLYTVAGEHAILALARSHARHAGPSTLLHTLTNGRLAELTLPLLADAAHHRDAAALATLEEIGACLGIVLANLVNTLNPDAVVLGGPSTCLGEPLLDAIRRELHVRAVVETTHALDISISQAGDEAGAAGAAILWISRTLVASTTLRLLGDRRPEVTPLEITPPMADRNTDGGATDNSSERGG
ncbi:MAG: ROK family protein [Luteitalea sp.]|nr:ROK family protein [Luteitalea sp.]